MSKYTILNKFNEVVANASSIDKAISECEQYFCANLKQAQKEIANDLRVLRFSDVEICMGGHFLTIEKV